MSYPVMQKSESKFVELGSMAVRHTSCLCTSHFRNSKNVALMMFLSVLKRKKMCFSQTVCASTRKSQREDSYFAQYQCKDSVRKLVISLRYLSLKIS